MNDNIASFLSDPTWIAAITGLAAIIFSFASLFFQRRMATFQIRASLKEKWVNEFKANLASYLTCSARLHDAFAHGVDLGRLNTSVPISRPALEEERALQLEYNANNEKAHELFNRMSLFLDQNNALHAKLTKELQTADGILNEWKREILKKEINEVKRLEIRDRGVATQRRIINVAHEVIAFELRQIL